ncbi:ufc1 [Scenedesmus sp. PABB004]|nr:ufc1 [Scenedesmus sp. PABB004]
MASSAAVEAVAGGLGSLAALVATYPLKTIYTLQAIRMQEAKGRRLSAAERGALLRDPAALLRALLPSLGALYSGLQPAAVETTASNAIYFYFYSLLRGAAVSALRARRGQPPVAGAAARREDIGVAASLGVAALAGAINMLATSPAQVVATQMQARAALKRQLVAAGAPSEHIRSDALGVAVAVWREDGPLGFWRGVLPNLALVVNPAVQYMAFEALTARAVAAKARRRGGSRVKLEPGEVFLLGAGAKILATVATYPMIVVKSRLQAAGSHSAPEHRYAGAADALRRIVREEGLAGLYRGMQAKLAQTALNAALMLMIKEQVHGSAAATLLGEFEPRPHAGPWHLQLQDANLRAPAPVLASAAPPSRAAQQAAHEQAGSRRQPQQPAFENLGASEDRSADGSTAQGSSDGAAGGGDSSNGAITSAGAAGSDAGSGGAEAAAALPASGDEAAVAAAAAARGIDVAAGPNDTHTGIIRVAHPGSPRGRRTLAVFINDLPSLEATEDGVLALNNALCGALPGAQHARPRAPRRRPALRLTTAARPPVRRRPLELSSPAELRDHLHDAASWVLCNLGHMRRRLGWSFAGDEEAAEEARAPAAARAGSADGEGVSWSDLGTPSGAQGGDEGAEAQGAAAQDEAASGHRRKTAMPQRKPSAAERALEVSGGDEQGHHGAALSSRHSELSGLLAGLRATSAGDGLGVQAGAAAGAGAPGSRPGGPLLQEALELVRADVQRLADAWRGAELPKLVAGAADIWHEQRAHVAEWEALVVERRAKLEAGVHEMAVANVDNLGNYRAHRAQRSEALKLWVELQEGAAYVLSVVQLPRPPEPAPPAASADRAGADAPVAAAPAAAAAAAAAAGSEPGERSGDSSPSGKAADGGDGGGGGSRGDSRAWNGAQLATGTTQVLQPGRLQKRLLQQQAAPTQGQRGPPQHQQLDGEASPGAATLRSGPEDHAQQRLSEASPTALRQVDEAEALDEEEAGSEEPHTASVYSPLVTEDPESLPGVLALYQRCEVQRATTVAAAPWPSWHVWGEAEQVVAVQPGGDSACLQPRSGPVERVALGSVRPAPPPALTELIPAAAVARWREQLGGADAANAAAAGAGSAEGVAFLCRLLRPGLLLECRCQRNDNVVWQPALVLHTSVTRPGLTADVLAHMRATSLHARADGRVSLDGAVAALTALAAVSADGAGAPSHAQGSAEAVALSPALSRRSVGAVHEAPAPEAVALKLLLLGGAGEVRRITWSQLTDARRPWLRHMLHWRQQGEMSTSAAAGGDGEQAGGGSVVARGSWRRLARLRCFTAMRAVRAALGAEHAAWLAALGWAPKRERGGVARELARDTAARIARKLARRPTATAASDALLAAAQLAMPRGLARCVDSVAGGTGGGGTVTGDAVAPSGQQNGDGRARKQARRSLGRDAAGGYESEGSDEGWRRSLAQEPRGRSRLSEAGGEPGSRAAAPSSDDPTLAPSSEEEEQEVASDSEAPLRSSVPALREDEEPGAGMGEEGMATLFDDRPPGPLVLKPHQVAGLRFMWDVLVVQHAPAADAARHRPSGGSDGGGGGGPRSVDDDAEPQPGGASGGEADAAGGCVLAHSMGLGKSFQTVVLLYLAFQKMRGRALLVAPTNVLRNWKDEFCKWLPPAPTPGSDARARLDYYGSRLTRGKVFAVRRRAARGAADDAGGPRTVAAVHTAHAPPAAAPTPAPARARQAYSGKDLPGEVARWMACDGGVLVVSYGVFSNAVKAPRPAPQLGEAGGSAAGSSAAAAAAGGGTPGAGDAGDAQRRALRSALLEGGAFVVADEAHVLKSGRTVKCGAMQGVASRRRLALTGYPLQNNLTEYYHMVSWVQPGDLFMDAETFTRDISDPIAAGQRRGATAEQRRAMVSKLSFLQDLTKGFVQRAGPEILVRDLPPKREVLVSLAPTPTQVMLLQELVGLLAAAGRSLFRDIEVMRKVLDSSDHGYAALSKLAARARAAPGVSVVMATASEELLIAVEARTPPAHAPPGGAPGGAGGPEILLSQLGDELPPDELPPATGGASASARAGAGAGAGRPPRAGPAAAAAGKAAERAVLPLDVVERLLERYPPDLTARRGAGEGAGEAAGEGAAPPLPLLPKEAFVRSLVAHACVGAGEKVVIFSQSLPALDALGAMLQREFSYVLGADVLRLEGKHSPQQRSALIAQFRERPRAKVFLISTRAGSVGINLVAARRLVCYDVRRARQSDRAAGAGGPARGPAERRAAAHHSARRPPVAQVPWNPVHNRQAVSRVWRYGQALPCFVYQLVWAGTIEAHLHERTLSKMARAAAAACATANSRAAAAVAVTVPRARAARPRVQELFERVVERRAMRATLGSVEEALYCVLPLRPLRADRVAEVAADLLGGAAGVEDSVLRQVLGEADTVAALGVVALKNAEQQLQADPTSQLNKAERRAARVENARLLVERSRSTAAALGGGTPGARGAPGGATPSARSDRSDRYVRRVLAQMLREEEEAAAGAGDTQAAGAAQEAQPQPAPPAPLQAQQPQPPPRAPSPSPQQAPQPQPPQPQRPPQAQQQQTLQRALPGQPLHGQGVASGGSPLSVQVERFRRVAQSDQQAAAQLAARMAVQAAARVEQLVAAQRVATPQTAPAHRAQVAPPAAQHAARASAPPRPQQRPAQQQTTQPQPQRQQVPQPQLQGQRPAQPPQVGATRPPVSGPPSCEPLAKRPRVDEGVSVARRLQEVLDSVAQRRRSATPSAGGSRGTSDSGRAGSAAVGGGRARLAGAPPAAAPPAAAPGGQRGTPAPVSQQAEEQQRRPCRRGSMAEWDPKTRQTVQKIPLLTENAGPRDAKDKWDARLKQELQALITYIQMNKDSDTDWFTIAPEDGGKAWKGKCWYVHNFIKYEFDFRFDVPATYPAVAPEIELPELEGKTAKMYRGGKICLTIHFKPLWAKNRRARARGTRAGHARAAARPPTRRRRAAAAPPPRRRRRSPHFGFAHALCLGLAPWMAAEVPYMVEAGVIQPKV